MNHSISLQQEQEQRLSSDLLAVEARLDKDTEIYSHGIFDGATGGKPDKELWSNLNYRSGYLVGVGEYYDNKFKTIFDEPF